MEDRKTIIVKIFDILKTFDSKRLHRVYALIVGMDGASEQELCDIQIFAENYTRAERHHNNIC